MLLLSLKRLLSADAVVNERRACLRLCTLGSGWHADVSGLVHPSNSMDRLGSGLGSKVKLIVLLDVVSRMKLGNIKRTLSPTVIREQP